MNKYIFALLLLFAVPATKAQTLPTYDHIVIMLEENRNYSELVGNHLAPYINSLLADPNTAVFSNYYALISGSQPNYLMLFSGADQGVSGSTITSTQFTDCNLGASLISAGHTFTGFSDSLPSVGFLGTTSGNYARKHNPWSNWQGTGTDQLAPTTNQPFSAFPADFTTLPTVAFVVPDLVDDMHTPSDSTSILPGDTWFKTNLDAYIQWAKTHNSLFIFGVDESSDMSEHVLFFFIGQGVAGGYYSEAANNYRTLRTIEDMYHLPYCANSSTTTPITDVWTPGATTAVSTPAVTGNDMNIWPVPASDILNISIGAAEQGTVLVSLMDQLGRTIKTVSIAAGNTIMKMDVQDVSAGIYFIKVSGEHEHMAKRVSVVH